jgi:light-regulated signal transduction histidine kinase (bacteriophytochrome)
VISLEQIKAARAMLDISQRQLAKRAGVSVATLNNIERGVQIDPKVSTIRAIQQALESQGIEFTDEYEGIGLRFKPVKGSAAINTILIVDDSKEDRTLYKHWLARASGKKYRVVEAEDARSGYARMGTEERRMVMVDGARELNHVLKNLDALIMESGAKITFDTMPPFPGNPVQIMRLMQNLISNAIKYQPPDHLPKVHVGVENLGTAWRISVKDNGLGIDEAFTEKIFEPFRRLHTWEHIKGSGIGLAVCRKIVQNHGGEISVKSVPGQGSTFFITLPKFPHQKERAA